MYVGYSSVFTKQTISKDIVIPIRPMQAAITFSQCMSVGKMYSTRSKVSQQFIRHQLIIHVGFREPSDPMSAEVFKGSCFTCVSEGMGTVNTA